MRFESEIIFDEEGLIKVCPVHECALYAFVWFSLNQAVKPGGDVRQFTFADAQKCGTQRMSIILVVISIDLRSALASGVASLLPKET